MLQSRLSQESGEKCAFVFLVIFWVPTLECAACPEFKQCLRREVFPCGLFCCFLSWNRCSCVVQSR